MRRPFASAAAEKLDTSFEDEEDDGRVDASPFLKWAGGKSAIAERLASLFPRDVRQRHYREPFLGGGAMFFHLQPERAALSDTLGDLVGTYRTVQASVDALIHHLEELRSTHSSDQFYEIRTQFNEQTRAPQLQRAAWLVYLNKTCFNGLFRTNKSGHFNVPFGKFENPRVVDPQKIRVASAVLARATIRHATFDHLVDVAHPGDFIYMDPPYWPLTKTASFCSYADGAFTRDDQIRLAQVVRELDERGCLFALSNSDTPFVRELYAGFDVSPIIAPRAISAKGATRGDVSEVLVRNVKRYPKA